MFESSQNHPIPKPTTPLGPQPLSLLSIPPCSHGKVIFHKPVPGARKVGTAAISIVFGLTG